MDTSLLAEARPSRFERRLLTWSYVVFDHAPFREVYKIKKLVLMASGNWQPHMLCQNPYIRRKTVVFIIVFIVFLAILGAIGETFGPIGCLTVVLILGFLCLLLAH